MKKAAIYVRVSSEEQREGKNIESQIAELQKFADGNDYEIVETYKDDGWSGGTLKRPDLDRLRDDSGNGRFQYVLLNDVDRLSRDVMEFNVVRRDLQRKGIEVVFRKYPVAGGDEADGGTNELMLNILSSFAQFEKRLIIDRTRRGRRYKAEIRKVIVGHRAPYGYRYEKGDKKAGKFGYYEIIPEEAEMVKKIFHWVANEGYSGREVVRELTRLGVPTRNKREKWGKSTVMRILHNETYIGTTYYNKQQCVETTRHRSDDRYRKQLKSGRRTRPHNEWIPIPIPELAIIDNDTFDKVQKAIKNFASFSPRNSKNTYLLRGLIYCDECKSLYHGTPCHGKYYYRCSNRNKTFPLPSECKNRSIKAEVLDGEVWDEVTKLVYNPDLIIEQAKNLREHKTIDEARIEQELKMVDANLGKTKLAEAKMLEAYRHNIISMEQLETENKVVKQEQERWTKERDELLVKKVTTIPKKEAEKSVKDYCGLFQERMKNFNVEERQKFLRSLVNGIIFTGEEVIIQGEIPVFSPQEFSSFKSRFLDFNAGKCQIANIIYCPCVHLLLLKGAERFDAKISRPPFAT